MVTRAKTLAHPDWRKDLQSGSAGKVTGERLRARLDAILLEIFPKFYFKTPVRACLHGGGGPQVDEVTLLAGVIRMSKSESTVS